MVRVGLLGVGFMGWIHYLAYQRVRGIKLAAFSSRDARKRQGDWQGIQGNFGPPGEQIDVSKMTTYARMEELLADDSIDVVDICLPPDMHADVAVQAFRAGKHVFCEKPLALTARDCRRLVKAAREADRQLLVGHVLPMFPEYAAAYRAISGGKYGALRGGSFKRLISDPLWLKDFYDPDRVGGPLVDLHVHDAHFIRLLFGQPEGLVSAGRMRGEVVEYCHTLFRYPDPDLVVHAVSGVIPQQGRPFTHGFEIQLERATLLFESAVIGSAGETLMPYTVLKKNGDVERPQLGSGDPVDAFVAEIKEVKKAVAANQPSELLGGELAADAVALCHKQTESVRKRRPVRLAGA